MSVLALYTYGIALQGIRVNEIQQPCYDLGQNALGEEVTGTCYRKFFCSHTTKS